MPHSRDLLSPTPPRQDDPLAKGIWSRKPTKHGVCMLLAFVSFVTKFMKPLTIYTLIALLLNSKYIFIACSEYTNHIEWKNMNLQVPRMDDIRLGDVID